MADNVNITALVCLKENPITVGAWSHLWDPDGKEYIVFFIRKDRYSFEYIKNNLDKIREDIDHHTYFTLSLMKPEGRGMLSQMGTLSGRDINKYDILPHHHTGNYVVPDNYQYVYCCKIISIRELMGHMLIEGIVRGSIGTMEYVTINTWPKESWNGVYL